MSRQYEYRYEYAAMQSPPAMPRSSTRRLASIAAHVAATPTAAAAAALPADRPRSSTFVELQERGITLVDDAVSSDLLPRLRDAARELVALSRDFQEKGGYAMRHSPDAGPWGVRGTYDPAWGAAARVFTEYMSSKEVVDYACGFLDCSEDDLMLPDTDFVIFCNPPEGYTQGWHRDVRTYGDGGDWSEDAQRARWSELVDDGNFPSGQND